MTSLNEKATNEEPIIALDLARGFAALLVVLGHLKQSSFVAYANLPLDHQGVVAKAAFFLCRLGHEAVLIFFVLSGFLVGGRLLERAMGDRFDVRVYAIDRASRIMLPLFPAVALTVLVDVLVFNTSPSVWSIFANAVGLNGVLAPTLARNVPLWTLAYEIWFYMVAGAIALLAASHRPSAAAYLIACASVFVFTILDARYLLYWVLGALTIRILHNPFKLIFALCGTISSLVGIAYYQISLFDWGEASMRHLVSPAIAEGMIAVGVCLLLPLLCDRIFNRRLSWLRGPSQFLSSMSYTLYLTHFPLNAAMERALPQATDLSWASIGLFMLRLGIILLAARILFLLFEARTADLRQFLGRSRNSH